METLIWLLVLMIILLFILVICLYSMILDLRNDFYWSRIIEMEINKKILELIKE